jgi:hypothetical protein
MNAYEKTQAAYPVDLTDAALNSAMFETMGKHSRSAARAHGKPTLDIRYTAKLAYNVYVVDGASDSLADTLLNWANTQFDSIYRDDDNGLTARTTYWATHTQTTNKEFKKLGMVVKFSGKQIKKLADNEPRFDGVTITDVPVPKRRKAASPIDHSEQGNSATNTVNGQHGVDAMEKSIKEKLQSTDVTPAQLLHKVAQMVPVAELDSVMLELGYINLDSAQEQADNAVKVYKAELAAAKRQAAAKRKAAKAKAA